MIDVQYVKINPNKRKKISENYYCAADSKLHKGALFSDSANPCSVERRDVIDCCTITIWYNIYRTPKEDSQKCILKKKYGIFFSCEYIFLWKISAESLYYAC